MAPTRLQPRRRQEAPYCKRRRDFQIGHQTHAHALYVEREENQAR
jgi:hypothetical protein